MARKRTIPPEIWQCEGFARLGRARQAVYLGLCSVADDEGRLPGSPLALKLLLPALFHDATDAAIEADLAAICAVACATLPRAVRYEVAGERYFALLGYGEWQRIRRSKPSLYPAPPEDTGEQPAAVAVGAASPAPTVVAALRPPVLVAEPPILAGSGRAVGTAVEGESPGQVVPPADPALVAQVLGTLEATPGWGEPDPADAPWLADLLGRFVAEYPAVDPVYEADRFAICFTRKFNERKRRIGDRRDAVRIWYFEKATKFARRDADHILSPQQVAEEQTRSASALRAAPECTVITIGPPNGHSHLPPDLEPIRTPAEFYEPRKGFY